MQKTVRFFKLENQWYADVPGHTLEENEMVSGADTVLEEIDRIKSGTGEVFLTLADSVNADIGELPFLVKFVRKSHDKNGAEYILTGPLAELYGATGYVVWICNVTHDVLGKHPELIYILDIR